MTEVRKSAKAVMKSLDRFATEPQYRVEGWDTYGAYPVQPQACEFAKTLVPHLPATFVCPNNEGAIEFEWDDSEGGTYVVEVIYVPPREPHG